MAKWNKNKKAEEDEEIQSVDSEVISEEDNDSNLKNIYNDLDLDTKASSKKTIFINKTKISDENHNNIASSKKVNFDEIIQNFDLQDMGETAKAKLAKNMKKLVKTQEKEKVTIKFNDNETKQAERQLNYDKLSNEITEYQNKVKANREADVVDFTVKNKKLNFSAKSLAKNTSEMNSLEKSINDILVKNSYQTDEKILEKENNINIDPNEVAQRYAELKKIKHLLFEKELKNKRTAKIKSKLFHKIKKKQNEREELKILSQLQEVDPKAVKDYIDKKKMDRIKERLTLKHSLNSKFAKTIKKYNLHKDQNTKDAIIDNLKLKDKLLQKIKGKDEDELEDEEENISENIEENHISQDEDNVSQHESEQDEEVVNLKEDEDLLLDFNEEPKKTKEEDESDGNFKGGVFGMKFMQKSIEVGKNVDLKEKMSKVLSKIKKTDEDDSFMEEDEEEEEKIKLPRKAYGRQKNNLEGDELKKTKPSINKKDDYVINADTLNEINQEAKEFASNLENKAEINEEDFKKIIEIDNIKEENEFINKFLVKNNQNQIEFFEDQKNSAIKKLEDENKVLQGWDSWAGDTKSIQSKEYLRKKRQNERIEKFKQNLKLSKVLMNNSVDKKASNFLVKELPHPYKSESEYHKVNDSKSGIEWNTLSMYKKLIQPSIVKKIGQIIEPMKINDTTTAKKLCEIIEKSTKKKNRTKATI